MDLELANRTVLITGGTDGLGLALDAPYPCRVEDGRGGSTPFPVPAHQTGRADFRHPAFRLASPHSYRWRPKGFHLRFTIQLYLKGQDQIRCLKAHRQSPPPRHRQKHTRSQGPSLHRSYPASAVLWPCPTPVPDRRAQHDVEVATLAQDGSPPITRITFSCVPCPVPRRIERVHMSIASPSVQPSPFLRRVGIRIITFEACSGFTLVTARRIAQPPKAAFVTRLRPDRLPCQAARQLPDLSTTIWVDPSSTGVTRRRGALRNPG